MRTTVTLEPEIAARLKELSHRRRTSFKATLNDVLRRGLAAQTRAAESPARFKVEAVRGGFRPGVDPARLNQLADELEVEDFAARPPRRR